MKQRNSIHLHNREGVSNPPISGQILGVGRQKLSFNLTSITYFSQNIEKQNITVQASIRNT